MKKGALLDFVLKAGFDPGQQRDSLGRWTTELGRIENDIRDDAKETAVFVDSEGNIIGTQEGTETSVQGVVLPPGAELLTHNHPNGSSFSRSDIYFLMRTDLDTIRAVAPDGTNYEMSLLADATFSDAQKLVTTSWNQAESLADLEIERFLKDTYGDELARMNWREVDQVEKAAQEVLGRYSDRVNYYLANDTDLGRRLLKYSKR